MLATIRRLWDHLAWADDRLLAALEAVTAPPGEALREYAHILGADETWLARLTERPTTVAVWPKLGLADLRPLAERLHRDYTGYLAGLGEGDLARELGYTTSDGRRFVTAVGDILLQVALHAQYHRGKVNLLLRQAGLAPAPTDYVAFVRGGAAAVNSAAPPDTRAG